MSFESLPAASVSRSDLTIQFFDKIFGPNWESLSKMLASSTGTESDQIPSLIFKIAGLFNSIALMAMSLLWVWIVAQASVGTAREGKPLGAKFHSFWVPLRVAYSASLLAPVVKGLSLGQVIILTCVGFSVQTANMVWESGVDFLKENSGHVLLASNPDLDEKGRNLAGGILKSLSLRTWRETKQGETFPSIIYSREYISNSQIEYEAAPWNENTGNTSQKDAGSIIYRFSVPTATPEGSPGLTNGDFGTITFGCQENGGAVCTAREEAIKEMVLSIYPLAQKIPLDAPITRSEQWEVLDSAVHTYTLRMSQALRYQNTQAQQELQGDIQTFANGATSRGWVMAGSYFWTISRLTERAADTLKDDTSYTPPNSRKYTRGMLPSYAGIDASLDDLAAEQMEAAGAGSDINFVKKGLRYIGNYIVSIPTRYAAGHDVISTLAATGHYIIGVAETLFLSLMALVGTTAAYSHYSSTSIIGEVTDPTGLGSSAAHGLSRVLAFLSPGLLTLLGALFIAGWFFAYYLPALPYILWIAGVVGWCILVVEALVAAPLWIVAHSMPDGEGIAGNQAQQGYALLLSIMLRPPLMVTGLLFSYVLVQGLGIIIGYSYQIFHASAHAETTMGIPHVIGITIIFVSVMVVTSHKLFSLISHLPNKVTAWVHHNAQSMGEEGDEHRTRAVFGAVGHKTEGVIGNAAIGKGGRGRTPGNGAGGEGKGNPADESDHLPGNIQARETDNKDI